MESAERERERGADIQINTEEGGRQTALITDYDSSINAEVKTSESAAAKFDFLTS